ncbi:MAG TPA: FAD-dependent oxidoreductase [Chryseosolibacter sp.]|nr:FAD-dependent oxidoreductase [Chryseosolibacter sp.]
MKQVVIIGNGVSGITAARHIRKRSDHKITVISEETPHFFSRTALMYVYMGHLSFENTKPYEDWFWKKNRIDLVHDKADKIDPSEKVIQLASGKIIPFEILILATGSQSNFMGWPGQDLPGVQGLYSYQDLQKMEMNTRATKTAVIVGGGLIGVEMAEMLRSRNIAVTMLVREQAFWNNVLPLQDARLVSRHIASHGVNVVYEQELAQILPDATGRVKGVVTTHGEQIDCDFVGLTVGVSPNVDWLKNSGIGIAKGILVNEYLETNIPGIYAIGDCVERLHSLEGRKNIEQVWYTARMMGEVVAQTVCDEKTKYEPGPWFNSAKFFDIEFQNYGNVRNTLQDGESEFYWEHAGGRKALHLVWDNRTHRFIGINSFGIRLRHENFDRWLREKRPVTFVIDHLREGNFDPEFSERHEQEISDHFYKTTAAEIRY